jgi:hypothetical protein
MLTILFENAGEESDYDGSTGSALLQGPYEGKSLQEFYCRTGS